MKKIFFVFLVLFFLFPQPALSQAEFVTDMKVVYDFNTTGQAKVSHQVTITNAFSNIYATSYGLELTGVSPQNIIAYDSQTLPTQISQENQTTKVQVDFADTVVGQGKSRSFTIAYDDSSLALPTGEVWEVTVPRLESDDSFDSYQVALKVPTSWGETAYISPQSISQNVENGKKVFVFDKETISDHGVTAAFGLFQVFSFNLTYHLQNPLNKMAQTQIAIPPDTAFQKVILSKIDPEPKVVTVGTDGNWLATYELRAKERVDVKINGAVQIFHSPKEFLVPNTNLLKQNLVSSDVWQIDDPQIRQLATIYNTPRKIYNYAVDYLSYNYNRIQPNIERLGAKQALNSPQAATCMEFTDLFIAISRAAGIPAREINGFAYTENPEIEPLSLVADVLHAWPEYWNEARGVWQPVDPTWGKTTSGVDYFSKLDLRHFAFVIHGTDFQKPYPPGSYKLGATPQKDVFVTFGQLPAKRQSEAEVKIQIGRPLPFFPTTARITVRNPGPVALYNLTATTLFDNKINQEKTLEVLPPHGLLEFEANIPFSLLGTKTPNQIRVLAAGQEAIASTPKTFITISSLLVLLSAVLVLIAYFYGKTHLFIKKGQKTT
jgi:hypothetical protein